MNFPSHTQSEVEKYMGIVFKQAPDRAGGARRKTAEDHVVGAGEVDDVEFGVGIGVVGDVVGDEDEEEVI